MLLAIALLTGALTFQGDVSIRAQLSTHTAAVGEPFVFSVTVRSKSAEDPLILRPVMPHGMQVVGTSSSTSLEISMPGGRTNIVTQEYQIIAAQTGTFSIGPATVRIGGQVYRTDPQDITIGGQAPARPGDVDSPLKLHASINPRNPYVGQQVTLQLQAAIPADPRFRTLRPPSYDPPALGGFWIQDLPDPVASEVRVLNGMPVEVQTFSRAYFPLTPGRFTMPPGRLIYDLRGGVFFAPETREALSDSIAITVRPLPEAGRPASFNGAVGSFAISSGIDRTTAGVGDAITFTLVVEGTGNIKSLPPPNLPTMPGVDVFPPSEDATLRVVNGVVGGVKKFQWVLIPRQQGKLMIPAVEYAWFDPATEKYATASSSPVEITVTPAVAIATAGGDTTLAPIRASHPRRIRVLTPSPAFLALQLVPLLALLLTMLVLRTRTSEGAALRARRSELRRRTGELDALADADARAFHTAAIRLVEDAAAFARELNSTATPGIVGRATDLVDEFRAALYAPAPASLKIRRDHARQVRALVDDVIAASGTAARGRTPASILFMLCAVASISTALRAQQSDPFASGVSQYQAQNYTGALSAFSRAVQSDPRDASAWFNLGNAAYRTGDPGKATWAWMQALSLAPRDGDVRHNLAIVNARRAMSRVEHWFPISDQGIAWLAAACWWLCMIATIAYTIRPRPAIRMVAILGGTACVLAAGMYVARRTGPDIVLPAAHGTAMYAAPTTRTAARDHLEVGDAAEILERRGDWLLVRNSEYVEGWVRIADVLRL